jgi:anti-sigma factor RsiW
MADYLLGHLPEADEARLEAEYLADPHLQEQLLFVEDELIDAYVQGRLSAVDRARLEERFLTSPRGRRKLEFVNSLIRLAGEEPSSQHSSRDQTAVAKTALARAFPRVRRMLSAGAALLAVIAFGWSVREKLLHQSGQVPSGGTVTTSPSPSTAGKPAISVSILLAPTSRDAGRVVRASVPAGAQEVNIQLDLGPALHPGYRATLVNARDEVKWTASDLKPRPAPSGNVIELRLPASAFERGEYTLLLSANESGARPIAEYVFVIEKR